MSHLSTATRVRIKRDFDSAHRGEPLKYRFGLVSEATAGKVLEACLAEQGGIDPWDLDLQRGHREFRKAVKRRLKQDYQLDPFTLLLIFKLILLFLELWFRFAREEVLQERLRQEQVKWEG